MEGTQVVAACASALLRIARGRLPRQGTRRFYLPPKGLVGGATGCGDVAGPLGRRLSAVPEMANSGASLRPAGRA